MPRRAHGSPGAIEPPGQSFTSLVKIALDSPWGTPSDHLLTGQLNGMDMVFLPRHGRGHVHSPTTVPYRANIDALKRLGVTDIVSVSACRSFRENLHVMLN